MTRIALHYCRAMIGVCIIANSTLAQTGTTFTYQGELQENGNPANGAFNIDFELWDAATGGNQIGTSIENNDLPVVNGRFTVELDFGSAAFDNSERWLEIEINGGALAPRTLLTGTPYSIQTRGIVVDENKNVGIGTSTPLVELAVVDSTAGDLAAVGVSADDAAGGMAAYSSTFAIPHLADRVSLFSDGFESTGLDLRADGLDSDIRFYTGGFAESNERMRITDSGNVGIGTNSPATTLDVDGNIRTRSNLLIQASGGQFSGQVGFDDTALIVANFSATDLSFWTNSVPNSALRRLVITDDGDVGIGTGSGGPGFLLHVNGMAGKPGGGPWDVASDVRLKKNIEPIDKALETLLQLRGVTFEYTDPDAIHELSGQRIGMIAQEVEKVIPDWVNVRSDGYKTVTQRGFEALTVEALRELRVEKDAQLADCYSQIASQAEQIAELKLLNEQSQIENSVLRSRLDLLEKLVQQISTAELEATK